MLSIIVAAAQGNAIGKNNELLLHISEDLKYFKSVTTGHPVIMGRKTYESIGRPLPGRRNIVITRGSKVKGEIKNPQTTTLEVVNSIDAAIELAKKGKDEFFVIGGGEIYNQTFKMADKIYLTKIETNVEGADTFFPDILSSEWELESSSELKKDEENSVNFSFLVYKKR